MGTSQKIEGTAEGSQGTTIEGEGKMVGGNQADIVKWGAGNSAAVGVCADCKHSDC